MEKLNGLELKNWNIKRPNVFVRNVKKKMSKKRQTISFLFFEMYFE